MATITGLVLTYNGQRLLKKCLESLSWCDEILVVDSSSDDDTCSIAQACGARVLVHPWTGPGPQFQFAFEHVRSPWVVSLDQDEQLSPKLQEQLRAAIINGQPPAEVAGYYCRRSSFYFDRFLRHGGWYPDRLLRAFRPDRMRVDVSGPHWRFVPQGPTQNIDADIIHYPYASLEEHLSKLNYYTQEAAKDLERKGLRGGLASALGHGFARFFKLYVLKRGFLDGQAGFINALHGFIYAFHKYIRLAEKRPWGE